MGNGGRPGMTRRASLGLAAGGMAAAAATRAGAGGGGAGKGPTERGLNVLLITTDQEQPWRKYPSQVGLRNHERLMARSTHFENWTVNSVPCGPSRSVLYTGQHIQKTRIIDNPGVPPWTNSLDEGILTVGKLFKEAGYRTVYKGKWHLSVIRPDGTGSFRGGLKPYGFDDYQQGPEAVGLGHDGYAHDPEIAKDAVEWLMTEGRNADQPWLLTVNFLNPHDIMFFDATGKMNDTRLPMRGNPTVMKPSPATPPYGQGPRVALPPSFNLDRSGMLECHKVFQEDDELFLGVIEDGDRTGWLNFVNYYADCLRDVDRHLGTVLDGLEAAGLADSTVVVFTADHGEMAAAHGQRQKGPFIYAENLGVPMMVSHPDARSARGSTTKALGSAVDLAPTLLGLAGLDSDAAIGRHPELVGHDLTSTVANPDAPGRRDEKAGAILLSYSAFYTGSPEIRRKRGALTFIEDPVERAVAQTRPPYFVEYERRTFYRGLFDGRYRFARYFSPRDHHAPTDWANLAGRNDLELYDTVADPLEMTNLALDAEGHRELLLALNARLNALVEREVGVDDGRHLPGPRFQWKVW
jgi:arylsulfatase A-like enzyme